MKIGILKEATETEQRVALVPQIAQLLSKQKVEWMIESGAGISAGFNTVYRKFKPPFSERRYIAEPASMSIVGAISEICGFASVASGGAAVGNVRSVPDRAARSYSFGSLPNTFGEIIS